MKTYRVRAVGLEVLPSLECQARPLHPFPVGGAGPKARNQGLVLASVTGVSCDPSQVPSPPTGLGFQKPVEEHCVLPLPPVH